MSDPVWTEIAYDELADIWVAVPPPERDEVEAAVNRVNRLLRDAPDDQGESRVGVNRVMFEGRLTVHFRVEPGPIAVVLHVRWVHRRKP